jgi:hypothetical protein
VDFVQLLPLRWSGASGAIIIIGILELADEEQASGLLNKARHKFVPSFDILFKHHSVSILAVLSNQ